MTDSNKPLHLIAKQSREGEIERRVGGERRKTERRIEDKSYAGKNKRVGLDRRKITRRSCDRAVMWRRRFWRDQQRKRLAQYIGDVNKYKKVNLLYSEQRVELARVKAFELKILEAKKLEEEGKRLARFLAYQYDLDVNIPARLMLNQWEMYVSNKERVVKEKIDTYSATVLQQKKQSDVKQATVLQLHNKNREDCKFSSGQRPNSSGN